jgi:metal iron transporter
MPLKVSSRPSTSSNQGVSIHVRFFLQYFDYSKSHVYHFSAVGILGATVMPHTLFLGSTLATQDRISPAPSKESFIHSKESLDARADVQAAINLPLSRRILKAVKTYLASIFTVTSTNANKPSRYSDHENNALSFVRAHLYHGVADMVISLLGFAVLINAM